MSLLLQWIALGLIAGYIVVNALLWSKFSARMDDNEGDIGKLVGHVSDMSMHELDRERKAVRQSHAHDISEMANTLIQHREDDQFRFTRIENKLDVIQTDIKDILKALAK